MALRVGSVNAEAAGHVPQPKQRLHSLQFVRAKPFYGYHANDKLFIRVRVAREFLYTCKCLTQCCLHFVSRTIH